MSKRKASKNQLHNLFCSAIRDRRTEMGLTQEGVEKKAKLPSGFMSYTETGKRKRLPYPKEFHRLCKVLGFSTLEALELAGWLLLDEESYTYLDSLSKVSEAA